MRGQEAPASAVLAPAPVVREAAAPRRWSPKALLGATLLVLLGGFLVMVGLPAYSHRSSVVVVARPLRAGAVVVQQDLSTTQIAAGSEVSTVPAGQMSSLIGQMALTDLVAGQVVSPGLIGRDGGLAAGQVSVGVPLKAGQLPASGLRVGQPVQLIGTPGETVASGQDSPWASASHDAVVLAVGQKDPATGVIVVDLRVPQAQAAAVARLASTGRVAVLALSMAGG